MMTNVFVKSISISMLSWRFPNMDFIGILETNAEIVITVIVFVHKGLGTLP